MALTRIKTNNILNGEVRSPDIADGAVTFEKLGFVSGGDPGDVLTVDVLDNLVFIPFSLDLIADVDTTGASDGDALVFDGIDSTWKPVTTALGNSSNTFVVDDIAERDTLVPSDGDSAFVRTGADGEYEMYVYDSGWVLLATKDSARTDANTSEAIVMWNTGSPVLIGNVSEDSRVLTVTVDVTTAFNDASSSLTVGDTADNDRLLTNDLIDLTEVGTYATNVDFIYTSTSDTDIFAYFNFGTSTQGSARVIVTHI